MHIRQLSHGRHALRSLAILMLTFVLAISSQAAPNAKITLRLDNVKMEQALDKVEELSGYKMSYSHQDIAGLNASCNVRNATIWQVMTALLKSTGLTFEVKNEFVTIFSKGGKQKGVSVSKGDNIKVSGTVVDAEKMPLPGVTVMEKGSSFGVVTDIEGRFAINVDKGSTLVFSYVGMSTFEKKVDAAGKLEVMLHENSKLLDDVVVTGYQTLSKERATGAFDRITAETLASRPSTDLSNALQGMVAGMQATENEDGTASFLIRGTSSLYANTAPLVVVDGFPIEGDFSTINPNDVESVTVLKDAAAASIWGARSANGVIVVTTKKGQQGKLKVGVQAFYRWQETPDLDYILAQADSRTTVDYELMAIRKGWSLSDFTPTKDNLTSVLSGTNLLYYANKYYGMSEAEMNSKLDILRGLDNRQQLKDYIMQRAAVQQYNVSLSGANDRYSTYASLMYEKSDEATIKRGYERFMLNFNNSYNFSKWLTGALSGTFQRRTRDNSGVTVSGLGELMPYEMLLENDGSYAFNAYGWNPLIVDQLNLKHLPYADTSYNLLREVKGRDYETKTTQYRVNAGLNAKIWQGLSFDTKFQYEHSEAYTRQFDSDDTYRVRNMVDYYTKYDLDNDVLTTQFIPSGGQVRSSRSSYDNYVWRNQLTFNHTFGAHDIAAVAGFEMSEYKTSSTTNPTAVGYNPETNTSQPPYYGSKESASCIDGYPDYYGTLGSLVRTSYSDRVDRYFSYYGNASYMYDGKYGASFSIRADGSNYVTEDKSLRWSPMWSAGLIWNMANEKFMDSTREWVDRLTLRGTYGINGNSEKSTSPQTLLSVSANTTTGTDVAAISSYGNPMLRWEETYTTNLGVDFSLLHGVLSGKVDYYNKRGKYIVGTVIVPSVYGSKQQRYNNAEILNRGVEVELTGRGRISSIGLGLSSTVTFAYNYNEVAKLFYPSLYCYQYCYAGNPSNGYFVEGKPVGPVYTYQYGGMVDGVPHVMTPDGTKYSFNDLTLHNNTLGAGKLTYQGTTISPYTFGWANQISWKGFDLYLYLNGKFGGKFRAPNLNSVPLANGKSRVSKYIVNMMNSDGTAYPALPADGDYMCYRWDRYLPYLESDVEDASFIRVKEVSLTYNLPAKLLRKISMQNAKVFLQIRDLGMLWTANKHNYDPEWLPGTNKPATSYTLGVNVNF